MPTPDVGRVSRPRTYWQIGWELFRPEVLAPTGDRCPFAGPSFQLMRNLALARADAAPSSHRPGPSEHIEIRRKEFALLVAHVATAPVASAHKSELNAFKELLLEPVAERVGIVSYEVITDIVGDHGLQDLGDDIRRRIDKGLNDGGVA